MADTYYRSEEWTEGTLQVRKCFEYYIDRQSSQTLNVYRNYGLMGIQSNPVNVYRRLVIIDEDNGDYRFSGSFYKEINDNSSISFDYAGQKMSIALPELGDGASVSADFDSLIGIESGIGAFGGLQVIGRAFSVGETIYASSYSSMDLWGGASIFYEDGTKVKASELGLQSTMANIEGRFSSYTFTSSTSGVVLYVFLTFPFGVIQYHEKAYLTSVSGLSVSGGKRDYKEGEEYDLSGATFYVQYENGTTSTLDWNGISSNPGFSISITEGKKALRGESSIYVYLYGKQSEYDVYVSYCDSFSISSSDFGSAYGDSGDSISIPTMAGQISASYIVHEIKQSGSTDKQRTASSLSFSPSSKTVSSDRENISITVSATESGYPSMSAQAVATIIRNAYESLVYSDNGSTETAIYYKGAASSFRKPTSLSFKARWNNPAKSDVAISTESMAFSLTEGGESLVAGTSSVPASQESIYASYMGLSTSYPIEREDDYIVSVAVKKITMTLGNRIAPSNVQAKAVWAHGPESVDLAGFEVSSPTGIIMSSSDLGTVSISVGGRTYQCVPEELALTSPSISGITLIGFKGSYINGQDVVDLRQTVAEVRYQGAEYVGSAGYEESHSLDATHFTAACTYGSKTISSFDGTEYFEETIFSPEGKAYASMSITVKNELGGANETIYKNVEVIDFSAEISAITIHSVSKKEYHVGEAFLEGDFTKAKLWYGTGPLDYVLVNLSDSMSCITIDPEPGTVFSRTNTNQTVTVSSKANPSISGKYSIQILPSEAGANSKTHSIVAVLTTNTFGHDELRNHKYLSGASTINGAYVLMDSKYTYIDTDGERKIRNNPDDIYGYLEDVFDETKSASIILFSDYVPETDGEPNIEVVFPCYVKGYADYINKSHFGILFGNANAKNRLFLSGNPEHINCDWHSGEPNEYMQEGEYMDSNGDFTYFSDNDYCFYGQTDNRLVGYDIVSTDKMVAFKSKSKKEPTNYFRSNGLTQALDASGNALTDASGNALYAESFSLLSGNIGPTPANPKAIANLNGDTLFISDEGSICGLNIEGQVGDSQRVASSRSRYIDPVITKMDHSESELATDGKYLFAMMGGEIYVTHYETLNTETGQYEWYRMSIPGATCMTSIMGRTMFGDSNGSFFEFREGMFKDCDRLFIGAGGTFMATLEERGGDAKVVYDSSLASKVDPDGEYTFSIHPEDESPKRYIFYLVGSIDGQSEDSELSIDYADNVIWLSGRNGTFSQEEYERISSELNEESEYYLTYHKRDGSGAGINAVGEMSEYYVPYGIRIVESSRHPFETCFRLTRNGQDVDLYEETTRTPLLVRARLCRKLDGQYEVYGLSNDPSDPSFSIKRNGNVLKLIRYEPNQPIVHTFRSVLHKHSPVKSYWITAPATLGNLSYRKTIWAWTIGNDGMKDGSVEVCYATNERQLEKMADVSSLGSNGYSLDFSGMSFGKIAFGKDVVPTSYTFYRPLSVPFICFGFRNEKDEDSAIGTLQITYTIPSQGFGRS